MWQPDVQPRRARERPVVRRPVRQLDVRRRAHGSQRLHRPGLHRGRPDRVHGRAPRRIVHRVRVDHTTPGVTRTKTRGPLRRPSLVVPVRHTGSMELLPGFRMRPPQDEDAGEVAAFSNEECIAFIGVPVIDADWLRARWTAPGVDRDRDFAVVESPEEELCGFLSVEAEPPFTEVFALGVVAPAFHGRGLGAAIVSETERRARRFEALADPSARMLIHAGALADEPRISALLSSRGYREVRRFELRRVDFADEPDRPRHIEGITVRGFRAEEGRQLYEAHVEAFADHWGEGTETYEDFRH